MGAMQRNHVLFAVALVAVVSLAGYFALVAMFLRQEENRTPGRAEFLTATMARALDRLDHLPFTLAAYPEILAALDGVGDEVAALNDTLQQVAERADAEAVFVMNRDGLTIASSNHGRPGSFVGQNYGFRPYFTDALAGRTGRFFAVGATTGRPGYFVAEAVTGVSGGVRGVVVVKVGFEALTTGWADTDDRVLVTNDRGIVLASSTPEHLFKALAPLSEAARAEIRAGRQFADFPLDPIDWTITDPGRVTLDGTRYVMTSAEIAREGWTLHLLSSISGIQLRALLFVSIGVAALLGAGIAAMLYRSVQLNNALAVSDADRQRLSEEIRERRQAEARLDEAQAELARASRLAALGQLSASITHELGQPISAMRNYLASEEIASGAAPGSLNAQLAGLVERMQNITNQLRFFATPTRRQSEALDLGDLVRGAHDLVAHDFAEAGITLAIEGPPAPVIVRGVQHRLEQVIVNLLRNARYACMQTSAGQVTVAVSARDGRARLAVRDGGPGLDGRSMAELQEPFMTTKPSGEGMGLGLAISGQIVKDHDGELEARDLPDGGASFEVSLPQADASETDVSRAAGLTTGADA